MRSAKEEIDKASFLAASSTDVAQAMVHALLAIALALQEQRPTDAELAARVTRVIMDQLKTSKTMAPWENKP
jgi:signal transduction histidine kinase